MASRPLPDDKPIQQQMSLSPVRFDMPKGYTGTLSAGNKSSQGSLERCGNIAAQQESSSELVL